MLLLWYVQQSDNGLNIATFMVWLYYYRFGLARLEIY